MSKDDKPIILLVSNKELQCGVHEFGTTIMKSIRISEKYDFRYAEAANTIDLVAEIGQHDPAAIIFNWHAITMPWAKAAADLLCDRPTIAILHDILSEHLETMLDEPFDLFLVHEPDLKTGNPYVVPAPRPIPWLDAPPPDDRPAPAQGPIHIGSFGFPTKDKNFDQVVFYAQEAFDECVIHIHLPTASFSDGSMNLAREVVEDCQKLVRKPGIVVKPTHEFLTRPQLLEALSKNDLNILLYDADRGLGALSSAADMAVAAGRPLALRRGKMFRHLDGATFPSIFVDDLSLNEILSNGTAPLKPLQEAWSAQRLTEAYECALDSLLQPRHAGRGSEAAATTDILLVGSAEETFAGGFEKLHAALTCHLSAKIRAVNVRTKPDLVRRVRETNARLVVVDWRSSGFAWLNWTVLVRLGLPVIALVRSDEASPSYIPFTRLEPYEEEDQASIEHMARRLQEFLTEECCEWQGNAPMTHEQIAYVAASSHGLRETKIKGFDEQDLTVLVDSLFKKGDDLWNAANNLRVSAEDWEKRSSELFVALEETIKSRDSWKEIAELEISGEIEMPPKISDDHAMRQASSETTLQTTNPIQALKGYFRRHFRWPIP